MMANLDFWHVVNVVLRNRKLVFELARFLRVFLRPKHVASPTCSFGRLFPVGVAIQRQLNAYSFSHLTADEGLAWLPNPNCIMLFIYRLWQSLVSWSRSHCCLHWGMLANPIKWACWLRELPYCPWCVHLISYTLRLLSELRSCLRSVGQPENTFSCWHTISRRRMLWEDATGDACLSRFYGALISFSCWHYSI